MPYFLPTCFPSLRLTTMSTVRGHDLDDSNQDANLNERDVNSQTPLLRESLDIPMSASKRLSLLFQNWWLWEILAAGTAFTAIAVITIILVVFNQSALPDWPSVFTVRSVTTWFLTYC